MLAKELLKKIRRIHIRTSHIANDVFAGQYHSAFKGQGMEFEEVREYQMGDDIRRIDWNVTARQGRPFIKRFREERELTVMLLVDVSGSMGFGSVDQSKRELAAEVAATLAFSAIKNNDKIGMIGFSDRVERFVKPDKGVRHVLRVVRELLTLPAGRGTNVGLALEHLSRVTTRRCVVFVVSDFRSDPCENQLRIARRRHDVIAINVTDPREQAIPKVRYVEIADNETGQRLLIDTSSAAFRQWIAAEELRRTEERVQSLRRIKIDSIDLLTGRPFAEPLTRFFRAREARL